MLNRINKKEIIEFNKVLSLLLLSRLSVVESIEMYIYQTKDEGFRDLLKTILKSLKSGNSLYVSFRKHKQYFDDVFLASLKIAEETGNMSEVLNDYNKYFENMEGLKSKLLQAIRYPILVLVVAAVVVTFMVFYLIPSFEVLFFNSNVELPEITKVIISFSEFVQSNYLAILAIVTLLLLFIFNLKRFPSVKIFMDKFWLKVPLVNRIYKESILSKFTNTMAMLLRSRVNLLEAFKIAKHTTENVFFQKEIDIVIKQLIKGQKVSTKINKSLFFDSNFLRLISLGEDSGNLERIFELLGDYYEKNFNTVINTIISLLEPLLIIIVGLLVGFILIAMYMPMFDLINNFGV